MVKKTFLLAAIISSFTAFVCAESDVIELDDSNFESQINAHETMLVEFFAPWCGHCKALAPEYEIAATELKGSVPLAKVDCSVHGDLCKHHGVTGYPTLKIYKSGEPRDYNGIRKARDIVEYMKRHAGLALRELDSGNFSEFQKLDRLVVVGYATDAASKSLLKEVAEKHRSNYFFGIISDTELAKEHGAHIPSVVVYKQFDEGRHDLRDELTVQSIEDFITASSVPLLQDINVSNLRYYIESGIPLAYIFHNSKNNKKQLHDIFAPIALKQKGKVNFVYIDADRYGAHASNIGLKEAPLPAFAIQHFEQGKKYPFDQTKEINAETMDRFVQDYVDGTLEAIVRSAEPPTENNGPIKVVVAKEFSSLVIETSDDVFLSIYAPWGDYNDEFQLVWDQVGQAVSMSDAPIVIAKLDHSVNDIPEEAGFRLAALPTLVYYKSGTKDLEFYDGDRSFQSLIDFINEHNSKNVQVGISSESYNHESDSFHDEL